MDFQGRDHSLPFTVFAFVFVCFNKLLHLFAIFMAVYKELKNGLTVLHNAVFQCFFLSFSWFRKMSYHRKKAPWQQDFYMQ